MRKFKKSILVNRFIHGINSLVNKQVDNWKYIFMISETKPLRMCAYGHYTLYIKTELYSTECSDHLQSSRLTEPLVKKQALFIRFSLLLKRSKLQ